MASKSQILKLLRAPNVIQHRAFTGGKVIFTKPSAGGSAASSSPEIALNKVTGLSNLVVKVPSQPVGPGASKSSDYKNPEYFCYHNTSYFEAEIEMLKYRIPQPSNKH